VETKERKGPSGGKIPTSITTIVEAAVRITSKGQVTIPQEFRERFGFLPLTEVEFVAEGDRVYLRRVEGGLDRGELIVRHLTGRATIKMSTDEIMELMRGRDA
jgi:AbrB family looped-hinge helix DNA binding protein